MGDDLRERIARVIEAHEHEERVRIAEDRARNRGTTDDGYCAGLQAAARIARETPGNDPSAVDELIERLLDEHPAGSESDYRRLEDRLLGLLSGRFRLRDTPPPEVPDDGR